MIKIRLAFIFLLGSSPAFAGPYEDADAAMGREDTATVVRIILPLANKGEARAQFIMGQVYYLFTNQNALAFKMFKSAADQGHTGAMYMLGNMYQNGHATPQNYIEAHKWYSLAAANAAANNIGGEKNPERATKNREYLARKMTASQVAEAQKLARNWKPSTMRPPQ